MSPLPTTSGTIDIGPELRPPPVCCGVLSCRVFQTMPATTSRTMIDIRTNRRPDRGLAVCEEPFGGASWNVLIGWFMNLPSDEKYERLRRPSASLPQTASEVRRPPAYE